MATAARRLLFASLAALWLTATQAQAQFDIGYWISSEENNGTVAEGSESKGSCEWEEPPENGDMFTLCSNGICRGLKGTHKSNGTVRFTQCKKHYVLVRGVDKDSCESGAWSSTGHKCIPCGRSGNQVAPQDDLALLHYGRNSSRGDFPWMAALYTKLDAGQWVLICGATLISPRILLTAAHCLSISGRDLKPDNLKVGLGKLFSDFYAAETSSVISSVVDIVKPERYVGVDHLFDLDIALLVLEESVPSSPLILPACMDWAGDKGPKHNEAGYLAGWGITEEGSKSQNLKWAFQKYIDYTTCRSLITGGDKKFLTFDKFCIQEVKGSKADKGDSGGGLTFTREGVHYVYGVVSTKLFSEDKNLRLFTNLLNNGHNAWLQRHWRRLHLRQGSTCTSDKDCTGDTSCEEGKCINPCQDICGDNTSCDVVKHVPVCVCKPGYSGNPLRSCAAVEVDNKRENTYSLTFDQVEGDVCKQDEGDGGLWTCKTTADCPLQNQGSNSPVLCGRHTKEKPLICCKPLGERPSRPSRSKTLCRWYSQSVYTQAITDRGSFTLNDTCSIYVRNLQPGVWNQLKPKQAPHLGLLSGDDFVTWCYGNLISERFMLASASCPHQHRNMKSARLGVYDAYNHKMPPQARDYDVVDIIYHAGYKSPASYNNLALAKLGSTVQFTQHIRPICLHHEHLFPGSHAVVIGVKNEVALKENVTVMTRRQCASVFQNFDTNILDDAILCVRSHQEGTSEERNPQVDRGMPLQIELEEPYCMLGLVGVAAFHTQGVTGYMRTSFYIPWIESIVWPES